MRIYYLLLTFFLSALPGWAAPKLYEKTAMRAATPPGWVSILGAWDAECRPYIKDMAFLTRWNPAMFAQTARSNQILFDDPPAVGSGYTQAQAGIEVVGQSEGAGETWSAHVPLLLKRVGEPFKSYRITGPGRKSVPGKLEAEGPEAPQLRIWEDGSEIRWDVSVGWQIQVDATTDEGERWVLLGTGKIGQTDLKRFQGQEPLIRIQVFRGLTCYVDLFAPGKGILEDPRYFLMPSYFQVIKSEQMSANPYLCFSPASMEFHLRDYIGRLKVRWDFGKLPFHIESLFPKKKIQMVFQAEWIHPPAPKDRNPYFGIGGTLLRDPERRNNLMLHRVTEKDGVWKAEVMQILGPRELPSKKAPIPEIGGYERFRKPLDGEMTFDTYWVITAD